MKLSCIACRQKKIKCDRGEPCRHCVKAGTQCVPQTRAKVVRRLKKTPADTQVLERLKQLESIVSRLEGDGSTTSQSPPASGPSAIQQTPQSTASIADSLDYDKFQAQRRPSSEGRLMMKGGKTTYVTGGFWANLTDEIADLIELTNASSDEIAGTESSAPSDEVVEPDETGAPLSPNFVLGFTSDSMTLRMMHPTPDQILALWELFKDNIGTIVKTVHLPTTEKMVIRATQDITSLNHSTEAVMFAIYYSTFLSLTQNESISRFGMDRQKALDRYRFATEQALARAGFLLSQNILLVQAFHLYIAALSRDLDDSSVPIMVTLMVNIAESMGLHRDGEQFSLPPFETEMRRRVWWTARTLDMRTSLDYDSQSLTAERWSDTKLPLNVMDEDIWPEMKHVPQPRAEFTAMTFSLLRWELGATFLRFGRISSTSGVLDDSEIKAHEDMLAEVRLKIEDRYLKHCQFDSFEQHPMQWSSVMLTKIVSTTEATWMLPRSANEEQMLGRLWLVIYHPLIKRSFQTGANPELRERAFKNALEAIQHTRALERAVEGSQYAWLMKPILQWHAIVIVLCVLCENPKGHDEAWSTIDQAFDSWSNNYQYTRVKIWKSLCRLYERAQRLRLTQIKDERLPTVTSNTAQDPIPPGFTPTVPLDVPDPMYSLPVGFDNASYGQPPVPPFMINDGFDIPMDETMILHDQLLTEEMPWDWSNWDATYNEMNNIF